MTNTQQHIETVYDNVEVSISSNGVAQQLSTLGTTFKNRLNPTQGRDLPTQVTFRTNQTISVQLNVISNDLITINSTDSPYEIAGIKINEIWITNNSGQSATVRMFFQPSKF